MQNVAETAISNLSISPNYERKKKEKEKRTKRRGRLKVGAEAL